MSDIWSVPYTMEPWTEILDRLHIGCYHYDGEDGNPAKAVVRNEFDLVVSLWSTPDAGPDQGVEHIRYRIADGSLQLEQYIALRQLARQVWESWSSGKRVLIRCKAGLNRSALLTVMVMELEGWIAEEAIVELRLRRSPYVLCNRYFEWYLRSGEVDYV